MLELLNFIKRHIEETGIAPSHEEMCQGLGLASKSASYRLVQALEERGKIRVLRGRARAIEVVE